MHVYAIVYPNHLFSELIQIKTTSFDSMKSQRRKFSPEEDAALQRLVEEHGAHKWDHIAASMPGRTGRQCRDRYQNYLCPGISRDEWTHEEEMLLLEKHAEYGSQWAKISKFFNGRTGTALKNRWNYYVSRSNTAHEQDNSPSSDVKASAGHSNADSGTSPVELVFGSLTDADRLELVMLEYNPFFGTDGETLFF